MNIDYYYGVESMSKPLSQFKHSKLLRKKDVELNRRRKKIDWLRKMYTNGMLIKPTAEDLNETDNVFVEDNAKNLIKIYENEGIECIDDWQVDELLEWTNTLSFKE